jgi:hypothetical protein
MDGSSRSETVAETRAASVMLAIALVATVATWLLFLLDRAPGTRAALVGFPLDDAWIHLVYARGLVTEGGFHYNPGVPEAGMTSPLWVVLLAPVFAIVRSFGATAVVVGAKSLSLACGLAGTVLVSRLARSLGLGAMASGLAALLFAIDPSLTFSRAAGMEVPLFVALVLATLLAAVRGRWLRAGIVQGLAIVARPEGVLLVPFVVFLLARSASPRTPRRMALAAACALAPALLYSGFCLHATGAPLPNTFYAKFHAGNPLSVETLVQGWSDYVHGNLPYFTLEIGTLLLLIGTVDVVRRAGVAGAATLGAFLALFVGTLASRDFGAGHYHYWERWLIPSFPGLLIAMASGLGVLCSGREALRWLMPEKDRRRGAKGERRSEAPAAPAKPSRAGIALAVVAGVLLLAAWPRTLIDRAHMFAWNCQNIDEVDVALGRWVDANLPKDAVIAVNDAGALRYFGRRVTIDLVGLNDHRIRRALAEHRGLQLLSDSHVGWLVIFPSWFPELVAMLGVEPVHEARSPHYTVSGAAQDVMVVYRWNRTPQ